MAFSISNIGAAVGGAKAAAAKVKEVAASQEFKELVGNFQSGLGSGTNSLKYHVNVIGDVLNTFPWTTNQSPEAKAYAPRIKVKFYQQTKGQFVEAAYRWWELRDQNIVELGREALEQGTTAPIDQSAAGGIDSLTYKNMYLADYLGSMVFPFFSKEFAQLQHQFEGNKFMGMLGGKIGKALGPLDDVLKNLAQGATAGIKIEQPMAYGNTTPTSTSFSFNIYNTFDSTNKNILKNKKLVDTLIYLNSPQKYGPGLILPPVLVSYEIPGIKYSPVAQMTLNITSLGQVTYKNGVQIPDAYQVDVTFSDLLTRTRNFHTPNGPRSKVNVFAEGAEAGTEIARIQEEIELQRPVTTAEQYEAATREYATFRQ